MIETARPPSIAPRQRDVRLDFFRGLALLIILVSHIPKNGWSDWIPARFGFSDSAEIFVFCSGMASGIAFGGLFEKVGWLLATARVFHRVWQLYWGQIAVFVVIVAMLAAADHFIPGAQYLRVGLYLGHFADDPGWMFAHFLTLTYVPNYFDILPMYLTLLAMIPIVAAIAAWSRVLAGAVCVLVWIAAGLHFLDLPAEPWSDRTWFFNPFSWQLVFFTGYAFGRGWLRAPAPRAWLVVAATALIVLSVPLSCQVGFNCYAGWGHLPWLGDLQSGLANFAEKTHLGPLRYLHFMTLAYVGSVIAGEGGRNLRGGLARVFQKTGRETLPVFLLSLVLAQALGIFLDLAGHSWAMTAAANLSGCAILIGAAFVIEWFKSEPWRKQAREAGSNSDQAKDGGYSRQIAA